MTVYIKFFSANFICQFDLMLYPFDIQPCEVQITLNEKQLENTRYHNSSLHMVNPLPDSSLDPPPLFDGPRSDWT